LKIAAVNYIYSMKLKAKIDQLGTAGLWMTMLVSPCCFPLAAVIASALGFSASSELFGSWTFYVLQGMVILALAGLLIAYRAHRNLWPLFIAMPSAILIFYSYHFLDSDNWTLYIYAGMGGLLAASILNHYRVKRSTQVKLQSIITCPNCGNEQAEQMPENSCQFFYECSACKTLLKPNPGDCCVYCSYGTVKCPPVQAGNSCC
jgi:predicted ferric reductase